MKKKTAKAKASELEKGPWANGQIPKILICVPVLSWTHESATSFLEFWTDLMTFKQKGKRFHVGYKFSYRRQVDMAQNDFAAFALESGCTHLLLMDDDILNVKAKDLMSLLEADKDVVGGIMHTNGFPYAMCAFRRYNPKIPVANMPIMKGPARLYEVPEADRVGLQKVDLIPFAFTLIKTSVFAKIKKPWFKGNQQAPTDSWFADSVKKAKLEYYANFDVWLNHRGITRYNRPIYFQLGLQEQQMKNAGSGGGVIMLTPEEMRKHEILMTAKLEEAEKLFKAKEKNNQKYFDKDPRKPIALPLVNARP